MSNVSEAIRQELSVVAEHNDVLDQEFLDAMREALESEDEVATTEWRLWIEDGRPARVLNVLGAFLRERMRVLFDAGLFKNEGCGFEIDPKLPENLVHVANGAMMLSVAVRHFADRHDEMTEQHGCPMSDAMGGTV